MLYRSSAGLRRSLVKGRISIRRLAGTRSVRATRQLGRALRRDLSDMGDLIARGAAPHLPSFKWKWTGIGDRAQWRRLKDRTWLPYAAILGLLLIPTAALVWTLHDLPFAEAVKGGTEPLILIEAANGQSLARKGPFKAPDKALNELPPHLINAVISIEDRRFYAHRGIDMQAMLRALGSNMRASAIVQGGSTITQQLVRTLYLDRRQTLTRKVREAALSIWLETKLSKHEILTRYLNNVYFGAGATGIGAAALTYFGKDASDLTLGESALLAGLIVAPSYLNPRHNPEGAQARAVLVLDAMVADGRLDRATAEAAKEHPAQLAAKPAGLQAGTWFTDWVYGEVVEVAGSFQDNIRVRTTLVPSLQMLAEEVVAKALGKNGAMKDRPQAALVAMLPNGAVVAMVGGRNYQESEFNRAVQAMRQPGSAFKLFVYYAALRNDITPVDQIEDAPLKIDDWSPENFGGDFRGRVSVAEAFARSLNAASVRLALDVGLEEVIAAARDLGLDAPLKKTPSLALGSSEVSLLDLTGAYASVRAGVTPIEPWGIAALGMGEQGPLVRFGPAIKPERSLKPYQEALVALLKLVVDRGTGRAAALDGFAAGKTGTSQNYRDAWFIGFDEGLVVGVWVGNDDDTPMKNMTGGKLPAVIWRDFLIGARNIAAGGPDALEASVVSGSAPQCAYRACAQTYRSFRSSDCTYQPYSGPRKLCDK